MKQASLGTDQADVEVDGGRAVAPEAIALDGATARIEGGLLMVFGPDGDPLPPQAFQEAASLQPEASLVVDDLRPVAAARIAEVLAAQGQRRLCPADGDGSWLRAMLGIGPAPEPADAAELAGEAAPELTLFGRELLIDIPAGPSFLLRQARADDEETGLLVGGADGSVLDHDGLLAALAAALEDSAAGSWLEVDQATLVIALGGGERFRLTEAAPGDAACMLSTPTGDAAPLHDLLAILRGADPAAARPSAGAPVPLKPRVAEPGHDVEAPPAAASAGTAAPGAAEGAREPPVPEVPPRLVLEAEGLLELGWLEAAAAQATGGRVDAVVLRGLPPSVRPSAGRAQEDGWRIDASALADLVMVATPEDLQRFTLEIRVEAGDAGVSWSIPVEVAAPDETERGGTTSEALAVPLDFPPPLSSRNRLDYFTVALIAGLPAGATLSAGVPGADGRWTLAPEDLKGLRVHFPAGCPLPCTLTATGISIENRDGLLSTATRSLTIDPENLHPQPDGPPPAVAALDLGPLLQAVGDDRRTDAVAIAGLPAVVELSRGAFDRVSGYWVLRRDELDDVSMIVRDPALRTVSLKAKAVALDAQGGARVVSRQLEVAVPDQEAHGPAEAPSGPGFFRGLAQRRA